MVGSGVGFLNRGWIRFGLTFDLTNTHVSKKTVMCFSPKAGPFPMISEKIEHISS